MTIKKLLARFSAAFIGALAFFALSATGAASAASINVSGPGAVVVAHGAYGDISASGPLSKVYVSGNYGGNHGCDSNCQPQPNPCHSGCTNPCQEHCECKQQCGCEQNCDQHKKCWFKHFSQDKCSRCNNDKHDDYNKQW